MRISTEHVAGVTDNMVRGHVAVLANYAKILQGARDDCSYSSPESALAAPSDGAVIEQILAYVEPFRKDLKTVLLVGIGGSDLGTRAVYDALYGHVHAYKDTHTPRLLSFATIEPGVLASMREVLATHVSPHEVVLVVISKSGTTSETIANANILWSLMRERFGDTARRQIMVISDADAPLATHAIQEGIRHFHLPKNIGGRYSVFTSVGLVPLALLGVDIRAFCEGGVAGARAVAPAEGVSSAMVLAGLLYEAYLMDFRIHEFFMWHPELETLGKWYRQLLAESIGKERYDGTRVGITPTVALGSTDLHSLGQLVFGGPKTRITTFVAVPSLWEDTVPLVDDPVFMTDMLKGKKVGEVMQAIYKGVCATYTKHNLPYMRIELEAITARELGAFMTIHMASVMYLAQLLDVNAFDQPDVEAYKNETRKLLSLIPIS
ncbi:MAG: hypothetical protein KBD24_00400 [Candidatus Pacebacteria bacterium]|nr:hypothetical protein [Candidatus Paceibacterota bacterium]